MNEADLKIEKGIPMPKPQFGLFAKRFAEKADKMIIGDSILMPRSLSYNQVHTYASATVARTGKKFNIRKMNDCDIRVWRTA